MNRDTYAVVENYMLSCMRDSAHDKEHIYRVLFNALEIAKAENEVDYDILICSCLLHDIGRKEQYENAAVCHAVVGGEKAYAFLLEQGFDAFFAEQVKLCIQSHRYRQNRQPQSIEAKILFDADKLDAVGATGIARTLLYQGIVGEPLYTHLSDGTISNGAQDDLPSFFREYKFKLEKLYDCFCTKRAAEIAEERKSAAASFYCNLLNEITVTYRQGQEYLADKISGV